MTKHHALKIPAQAILTNLLIDKGILQGTSWIESLGGLASRLALITDERVKDLYALTVQKKLQDYGLEAPLFAMPAGEKNKTRATKEQIEEQMSAQGLMRDTAVIALGGGVVTDMAGFIAATYCRGLPFVSIPTTLLAQIDASIGGKVGVNTAHAKNLIGALYPARFIFIDIDTLTTLPQRELLNGLSEVIKYALIRSPALFQTLQTNLGAWQRLDEKLLMTLISESIEIKCAVVQNDPFEEGERRILNFGHTIGHALETACDYTIAHGEAVALGMIAEAYLSYRLGYLKESTVSTIAILLQEYGFPLVLPDAARENQILTAMLMDKKAKEGKVRCVLIEEIGKPLAFQGEYCTPIDPLLLHETINWMFQEFNRASSVSYDHP